ncbi:hypothetical protein FIBSPDRAFT_887962 [Athelia psychrophila]|uniref:Uncharacterized protein n=1 Tax=Athelia psychrophila TaxID=1759441 RepID=A0A166P5B5_9AGAM|nr:hypothetical protein FIBSPDRAFT_887962 [Fibularhizoctonia sp. CBS 109695]
MRIVHARLPTRAHPPAPTVPAHLHTLHAPSYTHRAADLRPSRLRVSHMLAYAHRTHQLTCIAHARLRSSCTPTCTHSTRPPTPTARAYARRTRPSTRIAPTCITHARLRASRTLAYQLVHAHLHPQRLPTYAHSSRLRTSRPPIYAHHTRSPTRIAPARLRVSHTLARLHSSCTPTCTHSTRPPTPTARAYARRTRPSTRIAPTCITHARLRASRPPAYVYRTSSLAYTARARPPAPTAPVHLTVLEQGVDGGRHHTCSSAGTAQYWR